jgi:hypothetical protein
MIQIIGCLAALLPICRLALMLVSLPLVLVISSSLLSSAAPASFRPELHLRCSCSHPAPSGGAPHGHALCLVLVPEDWAHNFLEPPLAWPPARVATCVCGGLELVFGADRCRAVARTPSECPPQPLGAVFALLYVQSSCLVTIQQLPIPVVC